MYTLKNMPALEEETKNANIFYKGPENRHFNKAKILKFEQTLKL